LILLRSQHLGLGLGRTTVCHFNTERLTWGTLMVSGSWDGHSSLGSQMPKRLRPSVEIRFHWDMGMKGNYQHYVVSGLQAVAIAFRILFDREGIKFSGWLAAAKGEPLSLGFLLVRIELKFVRECCRGPKVPRYFCAAQLWLCTNALRLGGKINDG